VNRRDVLKGMAAGLTLPLILSPEESQAVLPPELPAMKEQPTSVLVPPKKGIQYDGILGAIFIEVVDAVTAPRMEQMWVTRPNGDLVLHSYFDAMQNFQWLAEPEGMIIGPVQIECSCLSHIVVAGPRSPGRHGWMQQRTHG